MAPSFATAEPCTWLQPVVLFIVGLLHLASTRSLPWRYAKDRLRRRAGRFHPSSAWTSLLAVSWLASAPPLHAETRARFDVSVRVLPTCIVGVSPAKAAAKLSETYPALLRLSMVCNQPTPNRVSLLSRAAFSSGPAPQSTCSVSGGAAECVLKLPGLQQRDQAPATLDILF